MILTDRIAGLQSYYCSLFVEKTHVPELDKQLVHMYLNGLPNAATDNPDKESMSSVVHLV